MSLKVGDRIRIARQPSTQWVPLVGEVGYIEEIEGDHCNVQTFAMDGGCDGWGTVPLDCLEPYSSNALEVKIAERGRRIVDVLVDVLTKREVDRSAALPEDPRR